MTFSYPCWVVGWGWEPQPPNTETQIHEGRSLGLRGAVGLCPVLE